MILRVAALVLLTAVIPARAQQPAQPPPPDEAAPEGRVFCEQSVDFKIADREKVGDAYRRFLGVWSDAAWGDRICAALIVESIAADGTATIIYVYGPLGTNDRVPGGVLHGTGIIRDGELKFQNSDGSQFDFRPGVVDMLGHLTTPKGQSFEATFKQSF
jgi:hypothetical protein